VNKLSIAQKECKETIYWLRVLYGAEYISKEKYDELLADVREIYKILAASLKTLKGENEKWQMSNNKY
jgi:four helix bundle protein